MLHDIKSDKIQSDPQSDIHESNPMSDILEHKNCGEPMTNEQYLEGIGQGNLYGLVDSSVMSLNASVV